MLLCLDGEEGVLELILDNISGRKLRSVVIKADVIGPRERSGEASRISSWVHSCLSSSSSISIKDWDIVLFLWFGATYTPPQRKKVRSRTSS